jgi:hypothetical protein
MFGLSGWVVFWLFTLVVGIVVSGVYAMSGSYEGKKEEEEYGEDGWYHTF